MTLVQEFKLLAQHSASYNSIIDYVPLHEISLMDYEVQVKSESNYGSEPLLAMSSSQDCGESEAKEDLRMNFLGIHYVHVDPHAHVSEHPGTNMHAFLIDVTLCNRFQERIH